MTNRDETAKLEALEAEARRRHDAEPPGKARGMNRRLALVAVVGIMWVGAMVWMYGYALRVWP